MKHFYALSFLLATAVCVHAQVYTPPAADENAAPAAGGGGSSTPKPAAGSSPFGQEIPLFDPSAETITVAGITIPLANNRLLKARFEKYLNQAPEDDEAAKMYRETIKKVLEKLSPYHRPRPDLNGAFSLLPAASSYPGDANLCGTLAESIYTSMLSRQDMRGLEDLNLSLEKEKQSIVNDGDWKAIHGKSTKPMGKEPPPKEGEASAASNVVQEPGTGMNSLRYTEILRRIGEIEALKKANVVRTEAQIFRTKVQYQVNMVQWFTQRRYEHVLMAARFYNQIWKDGDTELHIDKNSDVSKLFTQSVGVSPTVSSLDSLSNEVIREVGKTLEAFELLLSRGDLHSATQRLMEAFAVGEFMEPIATLELEKKLRVAGYARNLNELYDSIQARDYGTARKLVNQLRAEAKDFPSSKAESVISAATLASDLAIEEAKSHVLNRDSAKATELITKATETWPTNPKLTEFRELITQSSGISMARNDFDRLVSEGNFREIARRQYEIAPSIMGDAKREEAFKEIMGNLTKIEAALGKAAEFSRIGQSYAAWEQLAELRSSFPDDPKLGREMELLAPKVADFTLSIEKATEFEKRADVQVGSALSWYLKARSIHPQSTIAADGVKRLSAKILPPD